MKKIILAGGSGFIGQLLANHFTDKGDEVVVLTRNPKIGKQPGKQIYWDGETVGEWVNQINNSDVLINLAGKSVNCRYTSKNRKEIFDSRLQTTKVLGQALKLVDSPPCVWINAASATIYRHAEDRPQDEFTGELGTGFSVDVCQQWEKTFFEQDIPGIRKVGLRMAIVLGKSGGVMPYFLNLATFGLGGKQGNGNQYFSWIQEDDLIGIIKFIMMHPDLEGIFNASSPQPLKNTAFMKALRNSLHIPFGLNTPKWLLKIGSFLLSTETELILKSRWVIPSRLQKAGYLFKHPTIETAIKACL